MTDGTRDPLLDRLLSDSATKERIREIDDAIASRGAPPGEEGKLEPLERRTADPFSVAGEPVPGYPDWLSIFLAAPPIE